MWIIIKYIFEAIFVINLATENKSAAEVLLVDIVTVEGDTLQCNMNCVANDQCVAFTIIKKDSEPNVCKLHRLSTADDAEGDVSIPDEGDVTMIMTRGAIIVSTIIARSLLIPTTTTTQATTTTPPPNPMTMPTNGDLKLTALDALSPDKYIFYWSDMGRRSTASPQFTVVHKDDFHTTLQQNDMNKVFANYQDKNVLAAFTLEGITYLLSESSWIKYKIEFNDDELVSKAVKQDGGISNAMIKPGPRSATVIGNDTLLFKYADKTHACYHKDVINDRQIANPPPNRECTVLIDIIKKNVTLVENMSILGHDDITLRLFVDNKLYRF